MQFILEPGYQEQVVTARRKELKVCWSLQRGTKQNLHHTTCCQSQGKFFPSVKCDLLEAVNIHRDNHSTKCFCRTVCMTQSLDIGRRWPNIGYDKYWKPLGNDYKDRAKEIAPNWQGPQLLWDEAGQLKPMHFTEWTLISNQANNHCRTHFK